MIAIWLMAGAALTVMLLNVGLLVKMLVVLDDLRASASINATTQKEIQEAARVVAEDLAARYLRADAVTGEVGEAADVAARSQPAE